MDEVGIRDANIRDVTLLAEMDKVCFSSLPWSERSFFEEITGNDIARYIVAEIAGQVVGYAGMWVILDEGHITNVAVMPEFRRRGIAKALVRALLDKSACEGTKAYTLEVRVSNQNAITLYGSLGFSARGIRKKYYEDNSEDALVMWREIKHTDE